MAHELYTRTNQKLFFAGLVLERLRKAEDWAVVNALALQQAEREAALFHLYGAVLSLCHEITGHYKLAVAGAPRVDLILNTQTLQASPNPELSELLEIVQQPESWLAQLLEAHAALHRPQQVPKKAKVDSTLPLIEAVSAEESQVQLCSADLECWRQQLKQLVLRYRESLSEC